MSTHSPADERMQGFAQRETLETLWQWIDQLSPLEAEALPLTQAIGRCLAADFLAPHDLPPVDRVAMDGYALQGFATIGASEYNPLSFDLKGLATVAQPYQGQAGNQQAVTVMTGAAVPAGTDAILPAEYAEVIAEQLMVTQAVAPADHIIRAGSDYAANSCVLTAGQVLRPQDLAALAAFAQQTVEVTRSPKVAIFSNGDEFLNTSQPVCDANAPMLQALIQRDGGQLSSVQSLPDQAEAISKALAETKADVILISGGAGIGLDDLVAQVLAEQGQLLAHGVAARPCSGAGLGVLNGIPVVLLSGNPAACLAAYDLIAARIIRRLAGYQSTLPYRCSEQVVARKLVSAAGRLDYFRVQLTSEGLIPISAGSAGLLSSVTRADGFVLIPLNSEGYPPDSRVTFYHYDH